MSVERSDVDVLAAIAAGDRHALRVLHDRHAPWLSLRLARRCADAGVVDEALQDTFMAVWRGAGRYDGRGDVGAWIWGIAIRRLIDALRRLPRSEVLVAEVDDRGCVEEEVVLGVEHGDLGGALSQLSPQLRAVVQATVLDGLTSREAGRLLGIPTGTVKTRMMRARAQLRAALA
jgi:RNA polymerase sigma-70 factor (ECF subfamily)